MNYITLPKLKYCANPDNTKKVSGSSSDGETIK